MSNPQVQPTQSQAQQHGQNINQQQQQVGIFGQQAQQNVFLQQQIQQQPGQKQLQQSQQGQQQIVAQQENGQKKIVTNIPPAYDKFERADDTKKKQIYLTMLEQIKQYSKNNEELQKHQQILPFIEEELLRLRKENDALKSKALAVLNQPSTQNQPSTTNQLNPAYIQAPSDIASICKKIEEDQKSSFYLLKLIDGINSDGQVQNLMFQFQKEKDLIIQRNKAEKEVQDKKSIDLQKLVQQQLLTMKQMQEQLVQLTQNKKLEQSVVEQKQMKSESSKTDLDKISLLEKQILEQNVELKKQKDELLKEKDAQRHLEEQISRLESQIVYLKDLITTKEQNEHLLLKSNETRIHTIDLNELNNRLQKNDHHIQQQNEEIIHLKKKCQQSEFDQIDIKKQIITCNELMTEKVKFIHQLEIQIKELQSSYKELSLQAKTLKFKNKQYELSIEDIVSENSRLLLDACNGSHQRPDFVKLQQ